jgi:hypothetical protein
MYKHIYRTKHTQNRTLNLDFILISIYCFCTKQNERKGTGGFCDDDRVIV